MKFLRYIYITLFATVLVTLNSCSLDEKIMDRPTPATVTTESDVDAVINGMYSRFNDPGMFKFLGHIMLTITADDIYSTKGSSYGDYADRTYSSGSTGPMWDNMYATIANANNLIDLLGKLELSPAFEKRALGEAHFIRAFAYYYLVRLYGGVPLRLEAADINSDFYMPRASVDETYAQIFSDFKMASERLPLASKVNLAELGRATKGAAQALLAQAYLTYGNQLALKGSAGTEQYQNSVIYADSVIASKQYNLLTNYGDLFVIAKETEAYDEVIFGIRFQTDPNNRQQPAAGSEYATRFGAGNTWGVSANGGNGDNTFRVMHWFADYYRTGDYITGTDPLNLDSIDYRNIKAFFQSGRNNSNRWYAVYPNLSGTRIDGNVTDGTINDPLIAKYQDPTGKDGRNHGNDFFIIRMAEVYLIKAEALNELGGPTTSALAAFNVVRTRARTVNSIAEARKVPANLTATTAVDQNTFRMKIFDERGLELVGEGQRWFDLVRMRSPLSATQTMYEYQFKVRLADQTKHPRTIPTYTNQDVYSNSNAVYAPVLILNLPARRFLLFPIPSSEMIQNRNFGLQNPDW